MNKGLAIVLLLDFSNRFKLTEHVMPSHRKAVKRCAQPRAAFNSKGLIKQMFIMLFAVTSIFGCASNDIIAKYDTRNCILKTNGLNSVTQLTFWIDSGSRSIVFTPSKKSSTLNLCQILSDTLKLEPSQVALVSASFNNGDKKDSVHGEFLLQNDVHSIIYIKQSIQ